jgi:hypothetical protein
VAYTRSINASRVLLALHRRVQDGQRQVLALRRHALDAAHQNLCAGLKNLGERLHAVRQSLYAEQQSHALLY